MAADTLSTTLKRVTWLAIAWAVILILCGIISLMLPVMAGISTAIVLSILIIIAGVIHLTTGPISGSFGGYLWRTLVGIVYIIGGIWLLIDLGFLDGTPGPNRFGPSPKGLGGEIAIAG